MTSRELLITGAQELGIALSGEQVNSFFIYFFELTKWNKKINLTAIRTERDMVIKHGLDSLAFLIGFKAAPGLRLMDLGSGAGFPAFPIKIAHPEIAVTLVEAVKKKTAFLRHMARKLELRNVDVVDKRTNELSAFHDAAYDAVTARAFADMKNALSAGLPFLKPNGLMVLSRGPEETITEQELASAGVALTRKIQLALPHSDYERAIWVFKKKG